MGKRGPRPKLPEVARIEGNPGKRPIVDSGIEASGDVFVPEHLPDDAEGCIEVVRQSMPPKVYAALDSFTLAAFATAWAIHKRATHEINNPGFQWVVASARGGEQPNAWLRILDKQAALLASLGDRLGLNPKARAALQLPDDDRPKSKFQGLVAIRGGRSAS